MTAWEDYLAAAQRLDAVRREAAFVVAEQVAAVKAARTDLAGVRQRAALQRSRLVAAAKDAGVPLPDPTPTAPDLTTAGLTIGAPTRPTAVRATLRDSGAMLTATDAILSTVEGSRIRLGRISNWPVALRNVLVYLGFALLTVLVPLITLRATTNKLLLLPTIGCATVLPVFGYVLAWLTVGMLYRPEHTGRVHRTPLLGAAATVAMVAFLYTLYAALAAAHVL
ncbi:MAG: hypothetical protein V7603_316 [Micromonosporaceae bacterium]